MSTHPRATTYTGPPVGWTAERWPVLLLRLIGGVCLLALVSLWMPRSWIDAGHRWLGWGEFPAAGSFVPSSHPTRQSKAAPRDTDAVKLHNVFAVIKIGPRLEIKGIFLEVRQRPEKPRAAPQAGGCAFSPIGVDRESRRISRSDSPTI